jgi:oligopeptidase A
MTDATVSGTALPAFDRIRATEVEPRIRELLERNRGEVAALESQPHPTFANTVLPLEQLSHGLSRTWSPISHLNGVLNSDELRASYNACLPLLSNYWTDLAQSEPLFRAYRTIAANEADRLDRAQRRLIERALEDFRLAGVGLSTERKSRYKTVVQELAQLGAKFEENVLDAMNAWTRQVTDERELAGINPVIVEQARVRATEKGVAGWLFALEQPTYVAVMTDADSETLRRDFYEAWSTRASERGPSGGKFDNTAVMAKILDLRHEAAQLFDFPNYAAYALATRMAPSNQAVFDFLHQLKPSHARGTARIRRARAIRRPQAQRLGRELLRREAAGQVVLHLAGRAAAIFSIAARTRRAVLGRRATVRREDRRAPGHPDVSPGRALLRDRRWERQGARRLLSRRLCRPKKRAGAWMDDCVGRKDFGDSPSVPVAYLVCNFLPAAPGRPALLTHDDVVTMFHEFGHGLHHMLTRVGYPSIAGINGVSWDAVELPSQFLENFAWRPEVLATMARHLRDWRAAARRAAAPVAGIANLSCGSCSRAPAGIRTVRFSPARRVRPAQGARIDQILTEVRAESACSKCRNGIAFLTTSATSSRADTPRVTTVTNGPKFSPPTPLRHSRNRAFSTARWRNASLMRSCRWRQRQGTRRIRRFRGRPPDVNALLRQQGLIR